MLTITDFASRYLLTCEALSTTQETFAFTVFERAFKERGYLVCEDRDARIRFFLDVRLVGQSGAPRLARSSRPSGG
jgi:hypothetical protein